MLLAEHAGDGFARFDPAAGAFELGVPGVPADERGRWQRLGDRLVLLWRDGLRIRLRIGEVEVELGRNTHLLYADHRASMRTVRVFRGPDEVLEWEYPSQAHLASPDPFNAYDLEEDYDLVLYAAKLAEDPDRRKRAFATADEVSLGELSDRDLRVAARTALASSFPKRRVTAAMREIERWFWQWCPVPDRCSFCASTIYARLFARAIPGSPPRFSMRHTHEAGPEVCHVCIRRSSQFFRAAESAPRAEAVLADLVRALDSTGGDRVPEVLDALVRLQAAAQAAAVSEERTCVICRDGAALALAVGTSAICSGCVRGLRDAWRAHVDAFYAEGKAFPVSSPYLTGDGAVRFSDHERELEVWVDVVPGRPIEVFEDEIARWDVPHEEIPTVEETRNRIREAIVRLVRERHGCDVVFLDEKR